MRVVEGNILDVRNGVIIQQVNCQGVMGAGFAKAVRYKYPKVYEEYNEICRKLSPKGLFGCVQFVEVDDGLTIANSFSQYGFGDPAKTGKAYTDSRMLVANINYVIEKFPERKIYIPFGIGAGLGGGDWKVISSNLADLDITAVKLPRR